MLQNSEHLGKIDKGRVWSELNMHLMAHMIPKVFFGIHNCFVLPMHPMGGLFLENNVRKCGSRIKWYIEKYFCVWCPKKYRVEKCTLAVYRFWKILTFSYWPITTKKWQNLQIAQNINFPILSIQSITSSNINIFQNRFYPIQ